MVNNVNAQNYINEKYPTSGTCQRDNDPENKGKTRKGITLLDIRKGKVGNGIFSKNKNLIEDLKLEGFTNLRKLIISSHQITSLDISDCPNLEELDCRGNELTYLKVDGCSNLRKIDCSNNPLRELDLSTCSKLEEANINGCPSKLTEEGATKSNLTYDAEKGKLAKVIKEKDNERIRAKKEDKIKEISKVNEYNKKKEEIEKSNISVSEKEKEIKKIESETAKEINEGIKVSVGVEVPGLPVGLNALQELSNEIATDYFDYLKKKQELKEELEKLKLKEETNKESVTKEEESKDCVNVVIGIGERITQLEEKKEKLKKEIQEKEKIIRQKVLKHIFNNYYEINNILGGDFFISSIIGDDNDWRDINEEFVDKAVILKWLSRDDKKLTVEKIQELSHDVKQLKEALVDDQGPYFFHEKCFNFKESCGTTSETRSFQAEEFTYEGENYRIVDTVGIGDTKLSEREVLFKMAEGIYLVKEGIKQVLFVVGNKFTSQEIEIFRLLKDVILESGITEYTTIVKTKFPNFEDHEDCEEDRQTLQEENQAISKILEKSEIIYVDNPPLKGNSETIEANKKTRKSSQGVLFKHLKNNCQEEVKDAKDGVIQKVGTELEHAIEVSEVFSKEKSDLEELQKEWEELEVLRKKYLEGNTYLGCGSCHSRLHFNAKNSNNCWDCYLEIINRIRIRERNIGNMSFVERMNFNEAKRGYSEPNEEEKKQIELNNRLKILPQEIEEKETKIEELKKKIEEKTI
ncbi:17273_t:CDS:2 [Entrophospora sp. SA101]|nr:17273_t:CDS:2 [Entrophospora sp. SA101]